MQAAMKIKHVIVDGSNIATEGRDAPSLAQLDEAVQAFIEEYSPDFVTVVVDATFPNRIDRNERQTYEDAVNANELITPPAGAIGRGDAFILQIARRADAAILSNDSFQEFHGEYPWLFEKGRLIGGKPVPHVGWVFMDRAPVRGPTSRRSVSEARTVAKASVKPTAKTTAKAKAKAKASTAAESPDAEETGGTAPRKRRSRAKAATAPASEATAGSSATGAAATAAVADEIEEASGDGRAGGPGRASKGVEPYNEALPFIEFVAKHPVGSEVDAVIERFSSHGAYVMVGAARAYLPLRNLADPAPRSAKEVLRVGDERRFVVVSIDPPRRGIDLAVPGVVEVPAAALPADSDAMAAAAEAVADGVSGEAPGRRAPVRKARARKAAAERAVAAEPPGQDATEAEPAEVQAQPADGKAAASTRKSTRARVGSRQVTAKKATAKQATAKQATAKQATAKKATAKQATAKQATAKQATAKQATAKQATAKQAAARKTTARKTTAKAAGDPAEAAVAKSPTTAAAGRSSTVKTPPARKATRRRASSDASSDVVVPLPADAGEVADGSPDPAEATGG
jgi:hypothetical protein